MNMKHLKHLILLLTIGAFAAGSSSLWADDADEDADGDEDTAEAQENPPDDPDDPCEEDPDPDCCRACKDDPESEACCECSLDESGSGDGQSSDSKDAGSGEGKNGSLLAKIYMGRSSYPGSLRSGSLRLYAAWPSELLFTPAALSYTFNAHVGKATVNGDGSRDVLVMNRTGIAVSFHFDAGSSIGVPTAAHRNSRNRLQMISEGGQPVTESPTYYELVDRTGYRERFVADMGAVNGGVLADVTTVRGRRQLLGDSGLEVLRTNNVLRQVKTPQCLADIVSPTPYGYSIRFFAPEDVPERGTNALYEPVGEPYIVWGIEQPDTNTIDRIRITQTGMDVTNVYEYTYSAYLQKWTLITGGGERKESVWTLPNDAGDVRIRIREIRNAADEVVEKLSEEVHDKPWGKLTMWSAVDPEGEALTTYHEYYEDPADGTKQGRRKSLLNPNGSWEKYDYDEQGRRTMVLRPIGDLSMEAATSANGHVIVTSYEPVDPADAPLVLTNADASVVNVDARPRQVVEKVGGVEVARRYYAYKVAADGSCIEIQESANPAAAAYASTGNVRTVRVYYSPTNDLVRAGLLHYVEHPDGRRTTHIYERGVWVRENEDAGAFTAGEGPYVRKTIIHGTTASPEGIAYKTTREEVILDEYERIVCRAEYVYTGTGYELAGWRVDQHDAIGRVTNVLYSNGLSEQYSWTGFKKAFETDKEGITTASYYDALQRVQLRIKLGVPASQDFPSQSDIATSFSYDAAGRVLTETVTAGDIALSKTNEYDRAGRLIQSVDPAGLVTVYGYEDGGRVETVTYPGGAERRASKYLDGQVKSVTGSAATPVFYEYGVSEGGSRWALRLEGSSNSPMWVKTTTDSLGRTVEQERPSGVARFHYGELGHLVRQENTGVADVLYEYDDLGRQVRSGLDLNTNGVLDLDADRISDTQTEYAFHTDTWWKQTSQRVYPEYGSTNPLTVAIRREAIGGAGCGCKGDEYVSVDIHGHEVRAKTEVNPEERTVTRTIEDTRSAENEVQISVNGLPQYRKTATGLEYRILSDDIGRQIAVVDPRTGTNWTHFDQRGWVAYTEDAAGNRTTYTHDQNTGRRVAVTDALSNTTFTAYGIHGRVLATWGATYPVAYEYDGFGRMTGMYTYRGTNDFLAYSDFEARKSEMDRTTWQYDLATGLLTNKLYADGKGTAYSYDTAGRLASRTWARGITTTYGYDLAGNLTEVDYSDSTPSVSFTYDRLGRQLTITDILGTRTNEYDAATLQLIAEKLPDGTTLDRHYDSLGRPSGIGLSSDYSVGYAYDDFGRFMAVSSSVYSVPFVANYSYIPNSDLIGQVSSAQFQVSYTYEPHRNLKTQVLNSSGTNLISQFDYENDAIGRRTRRVDSSSTTNDFAYNIRSELIEAVMGTNSFAYQYDPIGNREQSTKNEEQSTYSANELNQYTRISNLQSTNHPSYDDDGNMVGYGHWTFTWDGENRLVGVASNGTMVVENQYDYMSRRIMKATAIETNEYLYDGWNMIRETQVSGFSSQVSSFVWGLDLSQSLQGAGGIGGLVSILNSDSCLLTPAFDANGNVTELVSTNGAIVAHYEYDPYGKATAMEGAQARSNPYRFSSKYTDDETGLVYYGYRFYSPTLGRWISRDPIGENGGLNVSAFLVNEPVARSDNRGLSAAVAKICTHPIGDLFGPGVPEAGGAGVHAKVEIKDCRLHNETDACCGLVGGYYCVYICRKILHWYEEQNPLCDQDAGEITINNDFGCDPPPDGCPTTPSIPKEK